MSPNLTIRKWGTGTPLLLLHGGPGPASVTPLAEHFAARHHVVAPTHPGWDGTERPAGFDSVGHLADAYLDLLDEPAIVVGTSFGGWVATELAARDDKHVARLVLIDSIGPLIPGHTITAPVAGRRGPAPAAMVALAAYAGETMSDPTLLPRLTNITCPVLVVWGEDDAVVSPAYGRALADAFPTAEFALVPGAGHLPIREQPDATFAAIDRFLAT